MINAYKPNVDKMYTYLRAYFKGAGFNQALKALQYAREKHKGQTRKGGLPYIVHPISMACYALALGIKDEKTIVTILLHDICEDCGIKYTELPFEKDIQTSVNYVTITTFDSDRSKDETKRRYYNELIYDISACITKGIDKFNNLGDMVTTLSRDAIGKNAAEVDVMLLPVLKKAKEEYTEYSDVLYILRTNLSAITGVYVENYRTEYEKWVEIFTGGSNNEQQQVSKSV